MSDSQLPSIGPTLGPYQILGKLGAGGMGVVYKALDPKLNRVVALKMLPLEEDSGEQAREALLREARAASALDHPNIGAIYGIEENSDGRMFIVMAFYDGDTLAQRIRRGRMAASAAVPIAIQIARGLAEAHAHHIVHRDIKPSNAIVTTNGVVKIVDFGLARVYETASATQSAAIAGTASYMSPEQALCKHLDGRTDLWSLGVVLYQMLTGRLPFTAESVPQLLFNVVNGAPADMGDVPAETQRVVYRALAKEPSQRYQSAEQMLSDLESIPLVKVDPDAPTGTMPAGDLQLRMKNASTPTLTLPAHQKKTSSRNRIIAAGLAVVLAAALLVPGVRQRITAFFGPSEKHIAVLPFTTIGMDAAGSVLADGLMDSLTGKLSNLEVGSRSLWVAPASEVRRLKVTDADAARREFRANVVVTGTIQRDGQTVRLIVNLIDASSRRQLGSGEFVDRTGDYALVQDSAVARIANLMDIPLTRDMLRNTGGSVTPAAYESYLTGLGFLQRYDKPGNLDQAVSSFLTAINSDPKFALGFASLGEAYLLKYKTDQNSHWIDEASANCNRAIELNDQLAPVYVTLGRIHDTTGKRDLAVQEFQHALDLDPRGAEAIGGLANVYENQSRYKEAEETFRRAAALRPDYWDGYNKLALFYYRRRRFEDAEIQLKRVLELTPDNANGWLNLGAVLSGEGKQSEAGDAYLKAIRIAPSYAAYNNLGANYYKRRMYADAMANYEQALKLNDKDYRVWSNLASAARWVGRNDAAAAAYRRALPLLEDVARNRPQDATVQSGLGLLYAQLGDRSKATARIEAAQQLDPHDSSVAVRIGEAYETLGDRRQAIQWITRALDGGYSFDLLSQDPEARSILSDPNFKPPTRSTK